MALSSADESFPAPGITRSITNFGMRQSFQYRAKKICEEHEDFTAPLSCCLTDRASAAASNWHDQPPPMSWWRFLIASIGKVDPEDSPRSTRQPSRLPA